MSSSNLATAVLEQAADRARRICEGDWCAVGVLASSAEFHVQRWLASPAAAADGLAREPADPALAAALRNGRAYHSTRRGGPFAGPDPRVVATAAALVLPIVAGGRFEGLVCLGRRGVEDFTGRDEMVLTWLAEQAAGVLAHARLLAEAARRRDEAEELAQLSKLMSQSLDSGEVAQRIVDSMRRLLGTLTCILYESRAGEEARLEPRAASGVAFERIPSHRPGVGAIGLAVDERRTVATADLLADPAIRVDAELDRFVRGTDHGAVLTVPLIAGDRVIGALAARGRTGRRWTADEMRLAAMLADHAAIALHNARLFAESRRQRLTAQGLALVARATARAVDLRALGQQIVDTLLLMVGGARVALFARRPGADAFELLAVARRAEPAAQGDMAAPDLGPVEDLALRAGRPVATADFLAEPELAGASHDERNPDAPIRAVLAAPLFHGAAAIGVLSVADCAGRRFGDEEVNVLQAAADHVSVALQNAYLQAQVTEAALARERVRIGNELHDTLSQLAFSVGLKLDWCLHRVGRTSALRPKLEDIRRTAGEMMERVRQLIGHVTTGPEPTTLSGRLERLAQDFRELTGAKLDLVIAGDPARLSPSSEEAIRKALQEALVNVAKHASATQVEMRVEIAAGEATFEVTDDGVGMPQALAAGLPGHFGLPQMRERLAAIGGRIAIRSRPGAGVSVRGAVPLAPPGRGPAGLRSRVDGAPGSGPA